MAHLAISIDRISKSYRLGLREEMYPTFREAVVGALKAPLQRMRGLSEKGTEADTFWALKDVSLEVDSGEVVGIIGRNGAGKSTLLKVLSRITEPTEGYVRLRGRVASLLEVGTGFHPELTGRENVYLNGSILGMKRVEIDRKFDEIVEFSGISRFLDTPVKRYSSGMYVRLAFAVAAHLEPEILIIDEVLAVGDAQFQKMCLGKMHEISRSGRTVLFVSHNMSAVAELCTRAVLIHKGHVSDDGPPDRIIEEYLARGAELIQTELGERTDRQGTGRMRFTRARVLNEKGEEARCLRHGEAVEFELSYRAEGQIRPQSVRFCVVLLTAGGAKFMGFDSAAQDFQIQLIPSSGVLRCRIPKLPLVSGTYRALLAANVDGVETDRVEDALEFEVVSGRFPLGTHVAVDHTWDLETGG